MYKTREDEHNVITIPLKVNNSSYQFQVYEQFNHHPPIISEELQKNNARISAFHPYQKDVRKSIQPPGISYSWEKQEFSQGDRAKTLCPFSGWSAQGSFNHQTNDIHEKHLISVQKPQRLKKNKHVITGDCHTELTENLNRALIIFNQNRPSSRYNEMNQEVKNSILEISLKSELKRNKSSEKADHTSWYLSQIKNQSSENKTQIVCLSILKEQLVNSQFSENDDEKEEKEEQEGSYYSKPTGNSNASVMEKKRELETQKNIPKPPPVPPVLPLPDERNISGNESVKRLYWEKIERNAIQDTIWAKPLNEDMEDILSLLMLDRHFCCKKTNAQQMIHRKKKVTILDQKKAYNISILLGHSKLSVSDIKNAILKVDESVLTVELLQQLLTYSPNETELQEYENLRGKTKDLNQADLFTYEMIRIPDYKNRIKALVFKANFTDRAEVLKSIIADLKSASLELRTSPLLTNILQLILIMGNYLNRGNERISDASGFRISFLRQIDNTKTSDNKTTFLHVLASAIVKKFPNSPSLNKELASVFKVAKVSSTDITNEMKELTSSQKDITTFMEGIKVCNSRDKIQEIMTNFLPHAKQTIQFISDSLEEALKELQATLHYFGEADEHINMQKIFGIFANFTEKFERSRKDISMKANP